MWSMIWNTFAVIGAVSVVSGALVVGIYAGCALADIMDRRKAGATDQKARFCGHCNTWIEEADRKRFDKGAKLWAAMCDPCINRVSGVWTDNGTADG